MKKYLEIGQRIKKYREQLSKDIGAEFTQQLAANRFNVSLRAYQNYEAGDRIPPGPVLSKMALFYRITTDQILTGEQYRSQHSFSDIIKRIKSRESINSDTKLAGLLGLERTEFDERKSTNSIPYKELVAYSERRGASLHFLLTGEGLDFDPTLRTLPLELRDDRINHMYAWIDDFWEKSTEEERAWFYIELQRAFPEFKEWIKKWELRFYGREKQKSER